MIDIKALCAAIDLPALIGETVALKKHGPRWYGLCPNHKEKSPSFIVYPGDGGAHCFSCGFHIGSAIDWIKWRDKLTFKEAAIWLTQRAGLDGVPIGAKKPPKRVLEALAPLQGPIRPDLFPATPAVMVPHRHLIGETLTIFPRSQVYAGSAQSYLRPLQGRDTLLWCGCAMDRAKPEMRALYRWAYTGAAAAVPWAKRVRIGFGWHRAGPLMFDPVTNDTWIGQERGLNSGGRSQLADAPANIGPICSGL